VQNARDELTADREIGSKSETSGSTLSKPDATAYSASFGQKSRESDVEEIVKYVERERSRSTGTRRHGDGRSGGYSVVERVPRSMLIGLTNPQDANWLAEGRTNDYDDAYGDDNPGEADYSRNGVIRPNDPDEDADESE